VEPTLRGVERKLHRAYEHHATLRDESPSILNGNRVRHRTVVQPHPDGHGYNFNLPPVEPLDSDRWSLVLGDFLFNLRAALDQLIYQLHVIKFGDAIPEEVEKLSAFPVRRKQPLNSDRTPQPTEKWGSIRELPASQRAMVERFQPYIGRNDSLVSRRAALLMIDTLNNVDKHRRLHVVRHVVGDVTAPVFPKAFGFTAKPQLATAVEGGAKVDAWRYKRVDRYMRDEVARQVYMHSVALEEVLDEPLVGRTFPVFELTRKLHNEVLSVITPFRTFFRQAGVSQDELGLPKPIPSAYGWLAQVKAERRWEAEMEDRLGRRLRESERYELRNGRRWYL